MKIGFHHSEETREKMRQARLGEKNPNFGKHHTPSPETREKNRQAHLGAKNPNFGKTPSLEAKEKNRQAHLGKPGGMLGKQHTPETIAKMSGEKNPNFGKPGYWTGKHLSPATKEKLRQALSGAKGPNWQGGISFKLYPTVWTEALKESIRIRDHHTCQLCGKKQEEFLEKLHIHHIDYDKKKLDPENLVSLCRSCHMKTNHNREEWIIFFQSSFER